MSWAKLWIPIPKNGVQITIQYPSAGLQQQVSTLGRPLHWLFLDKMFADDLVDGRFHEGGTDGVALAVALAETRDEVPVVAEVGVKLDDSATEFGSGS